MSVESLVVVVTGIVSAVSSILFPWLQNRIFQQQNAIFAAQAGVAPMPSDNRGRSFLASYWPMLVTALLAVLMWAAVGFDYYDRHHPSMWDLNSMAKVYGKTFQHETVNLDGHAFMDCVFQDVTFHWNADQPTYISRGKVSGNTKFDTSSQHVVGTVEVLRALNLLTPEFAETWRQHE